MSMRGRWNGSDVRRRIYTEGYGDYIAFDKYAFMLEEG